MLGAGALGQPRGMVWGGRREEGSGWGTCVYLWRIHVDIWQNQYNIVKLKKKERTGNIIYGAYLNGSAVKYLPAMQETQVQSLSQEDPLEKEMETHSSILA